MEINLLGYLKRSALQWPDKIAFADESRGLTYAELYKLAGSVCRLIENAAHGARRRPFIVPVERSCMNIAAMMGVLTSGNFYVPVDVHSPKTRIDEITRQLCPAGVVFAGPEAPWRENFRTCGLTIDVANAEDMPADMPTDYAYQDIMHSRIIDTDPAYVLFTSGSTGAPKGIVVPHRSVIDLAEWLTEAFGFSADDVFAEQTPFFFDASVKEIYAAIKNGATVWILPKGIFTFPIKVVEFLNAHKVTTALWATSAASMISSSGVFEHVRPQFLNKVSFAGETLYAKHLNVWRKHVPDALFVNLYGPTEITVDAAFYKVNREFGDSEVIPIGNACRNMEVFLLDDDGMIVSQETTGVTGEICIRGTGVAMGYYGDRAKTDEVFVQDPRNHNWTERIYKSGDLARYNERGELVFVTRVDGQIKHMGARVELGDIEAAALSLPGVISVVCIYDETRERIVLFFTGENEDLVKQLRGILPPYMCPGKVIRLEHMPMTSNGKSDRVTLKRDYADDRY